MPSTSFNISLALTGTITLSSGPTPPTPPVAGVLAWYRGDDVAAGAVSSWPDQSGNANDALQATGANQPLAVANVLNGHAGISFSGNPKVLTVASPVGLDVTTGLHIFVVGCHTDNASNQTQIFALKNASSSGGSAMYGALIGNPANPARRNGLFDFSISGTWADRAFAPADSAIVNDIAIWSYRYDNANAEVVKNGVSLISSPVTGAIDTSTGSLQIGAYTASFGGAEYLTGKILEILIFANLTAGQCQTVQAYLGTKYAIPLGQPQITDFDYTGLSGANFVTGGAARYCTASADLNAPYYFWFNTGTETDPAPGGTGIQVVLSVLVTDVQIADAMRSAAGSIWSAGIAGAVTTLINNNREAVTAATAATSGAVVTIVQTGSGNS